MKITRLFPLALVGIISNRNAIVSAIHILDRSMEDNSEQISFLSSNRNLMTEIEESTYSGYEGSWYLDSQEMGKKSTPVSSNGRKDFWNIYNKRDDYKNAPYFVEAGGMKQLKAFKYVILPIWWLDEDENDPNLQMNINLNTMAEVIQTYYDMSWQHFELSYELLNQQKFTVSSESPGFGETSEAAYNLLETLGYVANDGSFDGVMLIYFTSQSGPFSGGGGWGNVNGPFIWMSYNIGYSVTRHEVGHNFGHPHHRSMRGYRNDPGCECGFYDGFDMMSGGNGYAVSDFHVASKWFFGWVPDSAVVIMLPEGSTDDCPFCVSEGTFTITAFDKADSPPQSNQIMGIQIPIMGESSNKFYSYWLSYRSGVDGHAAIGLSIHLTWFSLGGIFGGSYDSLNYDALGSTATTFDSFVLPGTCYVIEPSLKTSEIDIISSEQVIPKVCVNALNEGNDITVTVSFLDREIFPVPSNAQEPDGTLSCNANGENYFVSIQASDGNTKHLIKVEGTGYDGIVDFGLCSSGASTTYFETTAYIYDRFPLAPILYGAPSEYGAFDSVSITECCEPGSTLQVSGARVVKITNLSGGDWDFLHLNEIEIYNKNGENVALLADCYSESTGYGGDPKCLNDGITGTFPETCNSHSNYGYWQEPYDFCVLPTTEEIVSIVIYPFHDPTRTWMTNRIRNLKIEVFASISGLENVNDYKNEGEVTEMYGLLATAFTSFDSQNTGPKTNEITLSTGTIPCPRQNDDPKFNIKSSETKIGEAWLLVDSIYPDQDLEIEVTCSMNQCGVNQYMENNICVQCPANFQAPVGTTSVDGCTPCPGGLVLLHPQATTCSIDENYDTSIESALGWRFFVPSQYTAYGWKLDVRLLEFYSNSECTGAINPLGDPIDSGHYPSPSYTPNNAFIDNNSIWGGRRDSNEMFWLGMLFSEEISVKCIMIDFTDPNESVSELRVQAFVDGMWQNVWIEKNPISSSGAFISWEHDGVFPTFSPSEISVMPSLTPQMYPSVVPSMIPSVVPSMIPSVVPSMIPSPGVVLSAAPQISNEWVLISSDDFEDGWGNFKKGGDDAKRFRKAHPKKSRGMGSVFIRDNSGKKSSFFSKDYMDVRSYSQVKIKFDYNVHNFKAGEDFFLEYRSGGEAWKKLETYKYKTNFSELKIWYDSEKVLNTSMMDELKIRFRCDASNNKDKVFIDDVHIFGLGTTS